MTQKRLTNAQTRKLVEKAIAAAKISATNDADFARMLRASYFTQHPAVDHGLRAATDSPPEVDPNQSVYDDPRFVRNLRKLAEGAKPSLRIIGGETVKVAGFPDCVAVGNANGWACTGTLIAPNVVLSAGHCATVATKVFFGANVKKKGTIIKVDRAVRHPDYKKSDNSNDLLLLILDKPASVKPRKLAATAAISGATEGRAVGFGNVDITGSYGYGIKRQVDIPIGSPGCSGKVNGKSDAAAYGCHANLEIVAGKSILTRDSCRGDSGGPFYIRSNGDWLLAGAVSRATKGAKRTCGDGGIYVRVDKYRGWIEKTAHITLP